jgi:hypothetical protein
MKNVNPLSIVAYEVCHSPRPSCICLTLMWDILSSSLAADSSWCLPGCMANNTLHLWLTTPFNGGIIIPTDALQQYYPHWHWVCCETSSTSSNSMLPPSTSANLLTPDNTEFIFFKITSVNIYLLLSHPILRTLLLAGIATFSPPE